MPIHVHSLHSIAMICYPNRIGLVMVRALASNAVARGFEPRWGHTIGEKNCICCFYAKQAALRRERKDWLTRNQDNVSECADISTHGLLFQWASIIKNTTKRVGLVQSGSYHHFIEINLFSPWYSRRIVELALSNNHSLTPSI